MILSACGGPATVAAPPAEPDVRALLPNGATSFVLARPHDLFEAPASDHLLEALVPDERLEALRVAYGVDLRTLDHLALGSYPTGRVVIAQGPFLAHVAVAELAHRMIPLEARTDGPGARAAGVLHGTHLEAVALGPHTLGLAIGPPELAGRMVRAAAGVIPPLVAGPVEQLVARTDAPFVWVLLESLGLPTDTPVGLLLAEQRTIVGAVTPADPTHVRVMVDLGGDFPPTAEANFRQLVVSLARTDLGTVVGLRSALGSLDVHAEPTRVTLAADLDAESVAHGLSLILDASIAEAVSDPPWEPFSVDN